MSDFREYADVKTRHHMERLPELDGLRAISILLVLAAHLLPLGPRFLQLNAAAGAMGMSLFFSLSGFLIASRLLLSPTVPEFIIRRMVRILPLVYLFLVILLVAFNEPISKVLWSATFLINYKTEYLSGLNSHLWSLCVEVQFYIAIAIAVLALGGRAVWLVWPACFVVTLLRINAGAFLDIRTHFRVDEILAGACVACLFYRFGKARFSVPSTLLACAVLIWGICSLLQGGALQYARPYAAASVLFAIIWMKPGITKSYLASKPARYIAEISYALYIIHPVSAYGWMNEGTTTVRYLLKRPASFLMTFSLAHLSTFYWEHLWIERGKKWLSGRNYRSQIGSSVEKTSAP